MFISEISTFYILHSTFLFILGLFFGSFFNVLADRLPRGETIFGRSHCESCKHTLAWYDLIPIFSYILLRGKCRYCKAPFSIQYLMVEIFTGVLFALTWIMSVMTGLVQDQPLQIFLILIIVSTLWIMFLADLRYQILPDEMQIAMLVGTLIWILMQFIYDAGAIRELPLQILRHLLAAVIVMLPILLLYLLTKGKGMGFGDVKLAFNMGFLLGISGGLLALYIAFISGGVVGGVFLFTKRLNMKSKIAFGPFLIAATYIMLFWGEHIITLVKRMYGF